MKHLFFVLAFLFVTPAWSQAIVLSTCGSANYSAAIGQLHQLTMDPAGYLCVSTTTLTRAGDEAPTGKPAEKPEREPKKP